MKNENKKMTINDLANLVDNLAIIVVSGFEQVKEKISVIEEKISVMEDDISSIRGELSSIKEEQKETNRRLDSIERKQMGTVLSLDETVPRREFDELSERVIILETKFA